MKRITLSLCLFAAYAAQAQPGVISLRSNDAAYPEAQPFVIEDGEHQNLLYFYAHEEVSDAYLEDLLSPFDLTLEDGKKEDNGDILFYLNNGNGFGCTINYSVNLEAGFVVIETYPLEEEE